MADIDTKLIGQIISSIPYDQAFGAPLAAAIDAQTKAAKSSLDFILNVGFTEDKNGQRVPNYAAFEFEEKNGAGVVKTRTLKIPLILLTNIPQLEITEGRISFDLEISQNAETKENIGAGGETEGKVGWGPFSLSFKAKASYSKESTRKTDTRAKQHVEMLVKQAEPPEAVSVLMEIMREAALGSTAGNAPGVADKSGGGSTPAASPSALPSADNE